MSGASQLARRDVLKCMRSDPLQGLELSDSPLALANQVKLQLVTDPPLSDESKVWHIKPQFKVSNKQAMESCRILLTKLSRMGHIRIDPQAKLVLQAEITADKAFIFKLSDDKKTWWTYKAATFSKVKSK